MLPFKLNIYLYRINTTLQGSLVTMGVQKEFSPSVPNLSSTFV